MRFPLLEKHTDLGRLSDPKIPLLLKTTSGFEPYLFLLDTGADFTMLPASFAPILGLQLSNLPRTRSYGIEGRGVTAYVAKVGLKIGTLSFQVTAFLSVNETIPLILGRQGFFDRCNIHFNNRQKIIRISPYRRSS